MTEQETTKGNVIIAEFMSDSWFRMNSINYKVDSDLKFNFDWNWIMPVVEKIEDLNGGSHKVKIGRGMRGHQKKYVCEIWSATELPELVKFESDNSKLETLFTTVVMFLKVYNKIKKR